MVHTIDKVELKRVKEAPDHRVEDIVAKLATTHSARGPSLDSK